MPCASRLLRPAPPDSPRRLTALETLSRAKASTTTPTTRSTVVCRDPVLTSGTEPSASSPGVVPTAKVAMIVPAATGDAVDRASTCTAWVKPHGRTKVAAPTRAVRQWLYPASEAVSMPSARESPPGSRGDHAATRGEMPVSRTPSRNITTATARTSTAVTRVGRLIVDPIAPSRAPRTANPATRPALKASWGRIRVTNGGAVSPRAASVAACAAEKPSTRPPTIAMHVDTPAVRPRTRTRSSPPRPGSDSPEVRSAGPMRSTSSTTETTATAAANTVVQSARSRLSHGAATGS